MKASSHPGDAGRRGPGGKGASPKRNRGQCPAPASLPRQRGIGPKARFDQSFLSVERILQICRERGVDVYVGAQVIVCQTLMKELKWRPTDLAYFSGNKIGQTALVLKLGCFPPTMFWLNVCKAFHLTMAQFAQKVQDWCADETSRS
ncbi:MAG: hypothetical protein JNJ83_00450 [Verrucomicrobiaceae bacterium]|nr:hypothetical protein [Verrucomicrobiaceae bacterium]